MRRERGTRLPSTCVQIGKIPATHLQAVQHPQPTVALVRLLCTRICVRVRVTTVILIFPLTRNPSRFVDYN